MEIRVGFGFDTHRTKSGRELWLGGVKIDATLGLDGHSDADVMLHALCDALLGAAGLDDIGHHFPNTDDSWKGADSKILLRESYKMVQQKGWKLANADLTLVLEAPKIKPYIASMKQAIANAMNVSEDQIGIKATTNEKLGYVGALQGADAYAVVLITRHE